MTSNTGPKRWPPLVGMGIAFVLVFVVLPNPLRIPQNNPTAAAEYAPVPGNENADKNSNFSQTNAGSSAGIGSGGIGSGLLPGQPPPPKPPQFRARQVKCVGNPPKQTEDPLSPPCVPFFDGDNGGSTYTGVTSKEIIVALYNDSNIKGNMNKPWSPSDEAPGSQSDYNQVYLVRTIKAQLNYFLSRYQTYGRTVHVIAKKSSAGVGTPCPQRQSDSYITRKDIDPFAVVHFGEGGQCYLESMAKDFKVPGFGLNFDVQQKEYDDYRPYIWGFFPPQEVEAAYSASFICRKLYNETAKYATDTTLQNLPRKFALMHPPADQARGPGQAQLADLLVKDVKEECGMMFAYNDEYTGGGQGQAATLMSKYKNNKVTTLVCYCTPVQNELTVTTMMNAADTADYHPEWYWDHASAMDRGVWEQQYGNSKMHSFGVSYLWRQGAFKQQQHYLAYLEKEPSTQPNTRFNFSLYHLFLNLFQGLQGAGPNLTPETVERGMFTFSYLDRSNVYEPVGGYGPYDGYAVADFNFVDTAMGWWWDPRGTPPGGKTGEGCIRPIDGGHRYYAGEWPKGDADLFKSSDSCSEDTRKLQNAGASTGI